MGTLLTAVQWWPIILIMGGLLLIYFILKGLSSVVRNRGGGAIFLMVIGIVILLIFLYPSLHGILPVQGVKFSSSDPVTGATDTVANTTPFISINTTNNSIDPPTIFVSGIKASLVAANTKAVTMFTLDGSDPYTSKTVILYGKPFQAYHGAVLRAYSYIIGSSGKIKSSVITQTID